MRSEIEALLIELSAGGILVAYSGGVDSALLTGLLSKLEISADRFAAVTFDNGLYTGEEIAYASELAKRMGVRHTVINFDKLACGMELNPKDRCYICKKYMFKRARSIADELGFANLIDGTNADDLKVYRPGRRALEELGVRSPLAESGLGKREVRELAKELGIEVWNRPSTPCLATRLPYGAFLDLDLLGRISDCESDLKALGFNAIRVRYHDPVIRIEFNEKDLPKVLKLRREIVNSVKSRGFDYVTIDLEGLRSGSMDIGI